MLSESNEYKSNEYEMHDDTALVNKKFSDLYSLCMNYKWTLKENTETILRFSIPNSECDEFMISVNCDGDKYINGDKYVNIENIKIEVSVPLWNSPITFSKIFTDYRSAIDFAYDKIVYFENKRK